MKLKKTEIKRILFITLTNIGDAVLTTPVLDSLWANFPASRIDVVVSPSIKGLFEKDRAVSKIFEYDKRAGVFEKYRLIKKLIKMRYDLIVDLKNTMIPFILFPRYRTSFLRQRVFGAHKKDRHLGIIEEIGIDIKKTNFRIITDEKDEKSASRLIAGAVLEKGYAVINAGAKSHVKRWPAENFTRLGDMIIKELGLGLVLVGVDGGMLNPDSDRVVVTTVSRGMKEKPVDIVGKTNTRELACVIKNARVLITNDSAPLHIASAVNTPTIAIFGPTDETKYGPLAARSVVVRNKLDCAPCEKPQCAYKYECLRTVTVETVFKAVEEITNNQDTITKQAPITKFQ